MKRSYLAEAQIKPLHPSLILFVDLSALYFLVLSNIYIYYAGDIALLANSPAQAESLQQSLERAAGGIGLHVNADKTEYMSFNQTGDIATLE